jgi:hypothetical protein
MTKVGRQFPSQPRAATPPTRQHARSFSLEAFRELITQRASLVADYLSSRLDNNLSTSDGSSYELQFAKPDSPFDLFRFPETYAEQRCITTASECSDDDLREEEGWIPIAWDDTNYPFAALHALSHKRSVSWHSTVSSAATEVFSSEEWTPPMTPVSPDFAEETFAKAGNRRSKDGSVASYGEYVSIDETMRWILESDIVY